MSDKETMSNKANVGYFVCLKILQNSKQHDLIHHVKKPTISRIHWNRSGISGRSGIDYKS